MRKQNLDGPRQGVEALNRASHAMANHAFRLLVRQIDGNRLVNPLCSLCVVCDEIFILCILSVPPMFADVLVPLRAFFCCLCREDAEGQNVELSACPMFP